MAFQVRYGECERGTHGTHQILRFNFNDQWQMENLNGSEGGDTIGLSTYTLKGTLDHRGQGAFYVHMSHVR